MSTILRPFEQENFFSWIRRMYLIMPFSTYNRYIIELFGKIQYPYNYNAIGIEGIVDKLEMNQEWKQWFLEKHTMVRLYKPFVTEERYDEMIAAMMGNEANSQTINSYFGEDRFLNVNEYKVCPLCYKEEKEKFGEAYIHVNHQVSNNEVCNKHQVDLIHVSYRPATYEPIPSVEGIATKCASNIFYKLLAEDVDQILYQNKLAQFDGNSLREKYSERLKEMYKMQHQNCHKKTFLEDFVAFYTPEFLDEIGCTIEINQKSAKHSGWIRRAVNERDNLFHRVHPIQHLLLIRFLFGGIEQLENYQFKKEPGLCLNPFCDAYGCKCIEDYEFLKCEKTGEYIGRYSCPQCGYTYTRNLEIEYQRKPRKIVDRGPVWREHLIKVSSQKEWGVKALAKEMQCSQDAIVTQSYRLGINSHLGAPRRTNLENTKNSWNQLDQETIEEYKKIILTTIEEDKGITRSQLKEQCSKEVTTLLRNCSEWCEKNFPAAHIRRKKPNTDRSSYYIEKDKVLSHKLNQVINSAIENKVNQRITKTYLAETLGEYVITSNKQMENLPISKCIIEERTESVESYKKRKTNEL